jgi:hypothetical protein
MLLAPAGASATTCASFDNQAAAQNAHNTTDADGDGIYCESLPCPCSTEKHAQRRRQVATRPKLGRPVALAKRTRSTGCRVHDHLPDARCTPGSRYRGATRQVICRAGYTSLVRDVSEAVKRKVYRSYGITHHPRGTYEVDHLIPLELGGSNSIANLFPEAARPRPGFHEKDQVENAAHDRVCSRGGLQTRQEEMAKDWLALGRDLRVSV